MAVAYTIVYYSEAVQTDILSLPDTLAAPVHRVDSSYGRARPQPRRAPHQSLRARAVRVRLTGAEGLARVFFCTLVGRRIVMLHSFIKKTNKTPARERQIAEARMKEVKHAKS